MELLIPCPVPRSRRGLSWVARPESGKMRVFAEGARMPEGDTVHKLARALAPDLCGRTLDGVAVRGRDLAGLAGRAVLAVESQGKHLFVALDHGMCLRSHLGLYGTWHRYRPGEPWLKPARQASLVLRTPERVFVCFNAREVELLRTDGFRARDRHNRLGPDLTREDPDPEGLRRRALELLPSETPVVDLLLDQRVASGIGNVYKSEVLFLTRRSPLLRMADSGNRRLVRSLRDCRPAPAGQPWGRAPQSPGTSRTDAAGSGSTGGRGSAVSSAAGPSCGSGSVAIPARPTGAPSARPGTPPHERPPASTGLGTLADPDRPLGLRLPAHQGGGDRASPGPGGRGSPDAGRADPGSARAPAPRRRGRLAQERWGRRSWAFFLAIALFGYVLPFSLISWGQAGIPSGLAGILMAVMPLGTLGLAHFLVPGERMTRYRAGGFLLGFAGVAVLVGPESLLGLLDGEGPWLHMLAVLAGAMCYAVSAILARLRPPGASLPSAAATVSIAAGLTLALVLGPADLDGPGPGWAPWAAVAGLGVFSTAAASVVYFKLVGRAGPAFVAQLNYLIPLWAVLVGMLFLGERPEPRHLLALALILGGIVTAHLERRRTRLGAPG